MLTAKQIDKINKIASFSGMSFADAKKFYLEKSALLDNDKTPEPTIVADERLQRRLDNEALGMRVIG